MSEQQQQNAAQSPYHGTPAADYVATPVGGFDVVVGKQSHAASVPRINIGGGIRIGADGSYSSEYTLSQVLARTADELVRMDYRRDVIAAFRKAHDFPKGSRRV